VPTDAGYRHDRIDKMLTFTPRAVLLGASEALPISQGELEPGIWNLESDRKSFLPKWTDRDIKQ